MIKLNRKYEFILMLVFLLLVSLPLYGGDVNRIGSAAGVQVQQPVGARDLAMAGSNIVYTKGIDALYWNPAGLSNMETSYGGMFTTTTIFNDIKINYMGLGLNMGSWGALAFDIKTFDFGDISLTTIQDMDGASGATFSPNFSTMGITYANKLTNAIQVGVKIKLISEAIPRASASAVGFDVGIQYKGIGGIEGVSFGVVAKNIGTSMNYSGSGLISRESDPATGRIDYFDRSASSDQLPASLEIGFAYDYNVMEKNDLLIAGVFQNNNVQRDAYKLGVEYSYDNFVALRGGYVFTDGAASDDVLYTFTMGAGIKYNVGGAVLSLDYAFRDSQYFDANNMFTLSVGF